MRRRRLLRFVLGTLAGALALVALARVGITTPWFKDWLRRVVVSRASTALNGTLAIGSLDGSLMHDLTLHDVVIDDPHGLAIRVQSLRVAYDLLGLIHHQVVILDLDAVGPTIWATQGADGWNLAALFRTSSGSSGASPWRVTLDHVRIQQGDAHIAPRGLAPRELTNLSAEATLNYQSSHLAFTVRRLQAIDPATGVRVIAGAADVSIEPARMAITNLALTTAASDVRGRLTMTTGTTRAIDGSLDFGGLAFADLTPYVPALPRTLLISGAATARGPLTALQTSWTLSSAAGSTAGQLTCDLTAPTPTFAGEINTDKLNLAGLTGQQALASALTGHLHASVRLDRADMRRSQVSFSVEAPDVEIASYRTTGLEANGTIGAGVLRAQGQSSAYGAHATFDATLGLETRRLMLTASGAVAHVNLSALPAVWDVPPITSDVGGEYRVALQGETVEAALNLVRSRVGEATIGAGAAAAVDLNGTRVSVRFDGAVDHLTADLVRLPITETAVSGTAHASLTIPDRTRPITLDRIAATLTAELTASTVIGEPIDHAEVAGTLSGGLLDIQRLDMTSSALQASAVGTVALGTTGASDVSYTLDAPDLSVVPMLHIGGLNGVGHIDGRLTGPAGLLAMTATINAHDVQYRTLGALVLNGHVNVSLPNRDISRATATADADGAFLTVAGQTIQRLTLKGTYGSHAIDITTHAEQPGRTLDVSGTVRIGTGTTEADLRSLTLAASGAPWALDTSGSGATVTYDAKGVTVTGFVLTRGAERLDASGTLGRDATSATQGLHVRLTDLDVASLAALVTGAPPVTGTAAGDATISGTLAAPVVAATVNVNDGLVGKIPFSRATATANWARGQLSVTARVDQPDGETVTATGAIPAGAAGGPLDVRVESQGISLGLMQAFTTAVGNVTGETAIDLHVTGSLAAPSATGTVRITNGGFLVTSTGVAYEAMNATLTLDGQRVSLTQFAVRDDNQNILTAEGTGDLSSTDRHINIAIDSDGMRVLNNELGEVEVVAHLRVSGELQAPEVTGRIQVSRGVIEVDKLLPELTAGAAPAAAAPSDALTVSAPIAGGASAPAAGTTSSLPNASAPAASVAAPSSPSASAPPPSTGLLSHAQLNITVGLPDNLLLRGRNLRASAGSMGLGNLSLTIGGTVEIRKAPGADAVVVGSLNAVRGSYAFEGRQFEVTRGSSVTFRGSVPIDPSLDVTGERNVSGILADVHVTGTARRPTLQFSSTPPLDEGDILSLIIFNQPMNQLGDSDQVSLAQQAGMLAASALATPLASAIGRALDLDVFEISTPSSAEAGQVQVGHQLSTRLFVGFRQEYGVADAARLSFEYRITNALRVLTSFGEGQDRTEQTDQTEAAGIDFLYTVRY